MPRPRSLSSSPREFFSFTEELLTTPSRVVPTVGPGTREAFALRAGMYHFWSRLRRELEARLGSPASLEDLASQLKAAGKLPDSADATLLRALYRVASNTSISIDGSPPVVRFIPKSSTSVAALIAGNLATPAELPDDGSTLLAEIERTKLG